MNIEASEGCGQAQGCAALLKEASFEEARHILGDATLSGVCKLSGEVLLVCNGPDIFGKCTGHFRPAESTGIIDDDLQNTEY